MVVFAATTCSGGENQCTFQLMFWTKSTNARQIFSLRPNLNLCSRDTARDVWTLEERRAVVVPPRPSRFHKWIENLLCIEPHLNLPIYPLEEKFWFQNSFSNIHKWFPSFSSLDSTHNTWHSKLASKLNEKNIYVQTNK